GPNGDARRAPLPARARTTSGSGRNRAGLQLAMKPGAKNKLRSSAAFTLIEVVLAIVIAVGMLVVVLFFYQQAADLRTQLLQETEHLSVARLLMDRITGELRTTRRHVFFQGAFIGESDFLQFIKTDIPSRAAWK